MEGRWFTILGAVSLRRIRPEPPPPKDPLDIAILDTCRLQLGGLGRAHRDISEYLFVHRAPAGVQNDAIAASVTRCKTSAESEGLHPCYVVRELRFDGSRS